MHRSAAGPGAGGREKNWRRFASRAAAFRGFGRGGGRPGDPPLGFVWAAAAGCVTGAVLTYWLFFEGRLSVDKPSGGDDAAALRHPAARHGLPAGGDVLRVHAGFVSCWDTSRRNPRWTLERLTPASVKGDGERAGTAFKEDTSLPPRFRSRLDDFRASGYDRGHLAAAANHRGDQKALDGTFSLSNVSPQVGAGFNRDMWARLEKWTRDLTQRFGEVFVVSGPLYLPRPVSPAASAPPGAPRWVLEHPMLGTPPRLVAVPTHFFKVVLVSDDVGPLVAAFVVPNSPQKADTPLHSFAVPLDALEDAVGTSFFGATLGQDAAGSRDSLRLAERVWMASLPPRDGRHALLLPPPPRQALLTDGQGAGESATAVRDGSAIALARLSGEPSPLCAHYACALPAPGWFATDGRSEKKKNTEPHA